MAPSADDYSSSNLGTALRPVERVMRRLSADGMTDADIAWRFRRTPGHVRRVLGMSEIERAPRASVDGATLDLRPIERVVRRAREDGIHTAEIAARLRRSPRGVAQIEKLASYKLARAKRG